MSSVSLDDARELGRTSGLAAGARFAETWLPDDDDVIAGEVAGQIPAVAMAYRPTWLDALGRNCTPGRLAHELWLPVGTCSYCGTPVVRGHANRAAFSEAFDAARDAAIAELVR